jgi:hypothetical protein
MDGWEREGVKIMQLLRALFCIALAVTASIPTGANACTKDTCENFLGGGNNNQGQNNSNQR